MTGEMDDASLLFTAAASVAAASKELEVIDWPVCADHVDDRIVHGNKWVIGVRRPAEMVSVIVFQAHAKNGVYGRCRY